MGKPGRGKRLVAASLEYRRPGDPGQAHVSPRLTAKGEGDAAQRILELARQHRIPIKADPDLITILAQLDVGQDIPPEIYALVAEILAFIYAVNNDWPAE